MVQLCGIRTSQADAHVGKVRALLSPSSVLCVPIPSSDDMAVPSDSETKDRNRP